MSRESNRGHGLLLPALNLGYERTHTMVKKPSEQPMTRDEIMKLIQTTVRKEIQTVRKLQTDQKIPPEPTKKESSRAFIVKRAKIAGTTDQVLLDLFNQERKKLRLSASRMLDVVLWNYFNKPKLSFEDQG
jgi:hypothetical protein